MKQLMSYYVMDDDTDEKIREMTDNLGLDGIESLVYGTKSRDLPGKESTIGCHLNYWPDWMNFWLGKRELFEEEFPDFLLWGRNTGRVAGNNPGKSKSGRQGRAQIRRLARG